ncbi:MAG: patatin-like phospholipase family protein [Ectothiorhodospiraceae bacterium]
MASSSESPESRIALVLQGGGALGAFQAGVFEALAECRCTPDWIAGTSIGAINGAIIAGNRPEHRLDRLKEFWRRVSHVMPYHAWPGVTPHHSDALLLAGSLVSAARAVMFGQADFFRPRLDLHMSGGPESLSFYDTAPLRSTLDDLVDFDVLNSEDVRLTVGAVSVTSGEMVYFDTRETTLTADHILASGALPPGFPPVRIDGELYWDGGIYSNTPLEVVLDQMPRYNTLCFMVNLWNQYGREPTTMADVLAREKEIRYASRFRKEIEAFRERHNLRHAVRELFEALPEDLRERPELGELAQLGCHTRMDIVRLGPAGQPWEPASKDADFEALSIRERWKHGNREARGLLEEAPWRYRQPGDRHAGVILHDPPTDATRAEVPGRRG